MEKQQTTNGVAYTNTLMQRLLEHYLLNDTLPGDKKLPFSRARFEYLLRCLHAEGYGK